MGSALSSYELSNHLLKPNADNAADLFGLTPVQIRLIRKSWRLARKQGLDEPGRSILLAIFKSNPEIERKFGTRKFHEAHCKNKPHSYQPEFYLHAQRFTLMLDMIVKNLENLSSLDQNLRDLGRSHARIPAFHTKYFDVFAEALIDKSLNWGTGFRNHRNSAMRIAWIKIVLFLTEKLHEGYKEYFRQKRRNESESRAQIHRLGRHKKLEMRKSHSASEISVKVT